MSVARSLLYAAANVLHPRMLWLMLWPMLVAVTIWGSLALFLWGRLALRIALWLQQGFDYALAWAHLDLGAAALVAANVLLFLLFVPLVYLTALFILSLFGMQQMVNYVAQRAYPALERRRGGGIAGTGWNSFVAFFGLLLLGLLSLPFWLFPPLWPVIPLELVFANVHGFAVVGAAAVVAYAVLTRRRAPIAIALAAVGASCLGPFGTQLYTGPRESPYVPIEER